MDSAVTKEEKDEQGEIPYGKEQLKCSKQSNRTELPSECSNKSAEYVEGATGASKFISRVANFVRWQHRGPAKLANIETMNKTNDLN